MDKTTDPFLVQSDAGEAELRGLFEKRMGPCTINSYISSASCRVWSVRTSTRHFRVIFRTPVTGVDLKWKAKYLAQVVKLLYKFGFHAVITAATPTREFFKFEVSITHKYI